MHTATADPLVGRTLEGRYRILDRIARGGMSTVYSAVDERLDRLVAVKVMSSALSADPAFSDRFTREARAAARLTHVNTVAVYDQGFDSSPAGHHVFLVMELVEGRTLRELIRERGRLSPAEAVSIMESVLSALSAAHRAGLVHRDVKPENILLSDEGVVKVADFGLARAVESDAAATRTGLMMGTVAYCSPEQITQGRADQRSDVYSAGVVLFELLTGKPPYHGESAMNVAYQHVHSRVPAPSSRVKGIPSEIDELVVTATDSDPEARPRDAGALLAELADVRTELALPVVPVPPRPRTRPNVSSRSAATGHTTDVLRRSPAPHDTSLVPSGHDTPPPRDPHAPPPPVVTPPPKQRRPVSARTRRRRRALVLLIVLVLLGLGAGYAGWWFAAGRYGRIPNVVSEARSVAVQDLRHAGYQVSRNVTTRYSESVPTGSVVATDPSVGSRLQRGKTVTLVVSKGKERYRVPSVANDTVAQAKAAFAGMPVQVDPDPVREADDTVPSGKVIRTDPAAGTSVKRDATIKLIVSTGPPIIGIPNIDPGTPADQAEQTLQRAGFKTTRTEEFSDTIAKGDVIGIDPSGSARKFSTITITVSKGPRTVVIPEIAQLTPVADAKAQLEKLGLVVKVEKAFGGQSGLVVGVDPPSGTSVPVGTKVTLTII